MEESFGTTSRRPSRRRAAAEAAQLQGHHAGLAAQEGAGRFG